jgi:hypothetical protein
VNVWIAGGVRWRGITGRHPEDKMPRHIEMEHVAACTVWVRDGRNFEWAHA